MYQQVVDALYNRFKDKLYEHFKPISIANMYDDPLDKEVAIMLLFCVDENFIEAPSNLSISLTNILSRVPYGKNREWIGSPEYKKSFAGVNTLKDRLFKVRINRVFEPLERLHYVYSRFYSIRDYMLSQRPKEPQQALFDLFDKKGDYRSDFATNMVYNILTRDADSFGLGLIRGLTEPKDLYIPVNKTIALNSRNFELLPSVKVRVDNASEYIKRSLMEYDPNDPAKYIPILLIYNMKATLSKMGYIISR